MTTLHNKQIKESMPFLKLTAHYLGETVRNDWECDSWVLTIQNTETNKLEKFDYFTGLGHRVVVNKAAEWGALHKAIRKAKKDNPDAVYIPISLSRGHNVSFYLKEPNVADILYSLVMDGSCASDSFADFCANCGYNEGSRKALEVYLACQDSNNKLLTLVTHSQLQEVEKILQDY